MESKILAKVSRTKSIILILPALILASCSGEPSQSAKPVKMIDWAEEAPIGQLGKSVVPIRYNLQLRIDPTQEFFTGQTTIELEISSASQRLWLHGKNLSVSEVYLTDKDSNRIAADYQQHLESGVALVTLEKPA